MKHGFIKIATAVPAISVGDIHHNARSIISLIEEATALEAEIVLFPELCLTSSTCGDLFTQPHCIAECEKALAGIAEATKGVDTIAIIGTPVSYRNSLFDTVAVIHDGEISAIIPKNILCNRGEANDSRWFTSGAALPSGSKVHIAGKDIPIESQAIFTTGFNSFGIEIGSESMSPMPPSVALAVAGAEIILNPCSKSEESGSTLLTKERIKQQSLRLKCGYALANSGWGESTSHAVYSGYSAIAECGSIIAESERFRREGHITVSEIDIEKIRKERFCDTNFAKHTEIPYIYIGQKESSCTTLTRSIDPAPFIPSEEEKDARFYEIFMIQATALACRIEHTRSRSAIIGISGGLDSTLALLVVVKAFDILKKPHSDIITVTMPGFGTSGRTYHNAMELMKSLGTTIREVSIKEACIQHFKDIGHDIDNHDTTYENSQARERTQILMDIANQQNGIVIGTGDMSELALGWATYNGDHMSMYGVNASIPKTLMQHIIRWVAGQSGNEDIADTLLDVVGTPISPELTPTDEKGNIKQKTEDLVGPYGLHDFFLYNFICNGYSPAKIHFLAKKAFKESYDNETIKKWLKTFMWRFFTQQFKRSCMPDGPRTGCGSLDAQGWNMPSDTSPTMFADMCNEIDNDNNLKPQI